MSRVLQNFAIRLKKDTQTNLVKKEREKASKNGRSANGNSVLWGTIKITMDPPSDPVVVTMVMQDYWSLVDAGRKPGKVSKEGQKKIVDWIKRKGIDPSKIIADIKAKAAKKKGEIISNKKVPFAKASKQFAFLVSRKLKIKGYPANHFYSEIINDGRLDKLKIDLKEELKRDIIIEIVNGSNTD